jgi:diaminopimelate decarboxylase
MRGFDYIDNILSVDGVALTQIAAAHGTPSYVYSHASLHDAYTKLNDALNNAWPHTNKPLIAYACKANSNLGVMNVFARMGAGCDIVSVGELYRALKAGFPPDKILFSGVGKTKDELRAALHYRIRQINVETRDELILLDTLSREMKQDVHVALRFNPDIESFAHSKTSTGEGQHKFGLMDSEIFDLFETYKNHPHIRIDGLSMHIGSGVPLLDPFEKAFIRMAQMIKDLRAQGFNVRHADLGGGLWVPYNGEPAANVTDYAAMIARIFGDLDIHVAIEPGRILVAEAGCLLTRVISVKEQYNKRFVIVDAGMNELIRPTLYDAHHPILTVEKKTDEDVADIVGPVCETGDYFALDRAFPRVKIGDLVAVMITGAYGSVMSSQYNTRPLCAEILVKDGTMHCVRKRQDYPELWAHESIPA